MLHSFFQGEHGSYEREDDETLQIAKLWWKFSALSDRTVATPQAIL